MMDEKMMELISAKHMGFLRESKYRNKCTESRAIYMSKWLKDWYYNSVGISSNELWKKIDNHVEMFFGIIL